MTPPNPPSGSTQVAVDRYLWLLKRCLTRELFRDEEVVDVLPAKSWPYGDIDEFWGMLERNGWRLVQRAPDPAQRTDGADFYPPHAETMIGMSRLDNLEELVTRVVVERIPGDLVETGVWRGGAVIMMRALLEVLGDTGRTVWACDSFQGLPEPDPERFPVDASMAIEDETVKALMDRVLAVSVEQVKANIARYGLLDDRVRFVEGWFGTSLPDAPIGEVALLRLDGDLYESTIDALTHLEPRVVPGGFVVVDDYLSVDACRQAVDDYRAAQGIGASITEVDWTGVWWRKEAD